MAPTRRLLLSCVALTRRSLFNDKPPAGRVALSNKKPLLPPLSNEIPPPPPDHQSPAVARARTAHDSAAKNNARVDDVVCMV